MHSTQKSNPLALFAFTKNGAALDQNNLRSISGGSNAQASIVMDDDIMFIVEEISGI